MHEQLNILLLNLGISTAGLSFGLALPLLLRLLRKALHLRASRHADREACAMMVLVAISTTLMVVLDEHITLRRLFLFVATSVTSVVLWIVRGVGTGERSSDGESAT